MQVQDIIRGGLQDIIIIPPTDLIMIINIIETRGENPIKTIDNPQHKDGEMITNTGGICIRLEV